MLFEEHGNNITYVFKFCIANVFDKITQFTLPEEEDVESNLEKQKKK